MKVIVLMSGGIDSCVLASYLIAQGHQVQCTGFIYGQRHVKELAHAQKICEQLELRFSIIDISSVGRMLSGSLMSQSSMNIPDGHYEHPIMTQTIVSNRNAIMLSIAYGIAVAREFDAVAFAAHASDRMTYPDCREEFVNKLESALQSGTESQIKIIAPFLQKSKSDIVRLGHELTVPLELTWSCYKGKDIHCGTCGTCYERQEAFELAKVNDPTVYERNRNAIL